MARVSTRMDLPADAFVGSPWRAMHPDYSLGKGRQGFGRSYARASARGPTLLPSVCKSAAAFGHPPINNDTARAAAVARARRTRPLANSLRRAEKGRAVPAPGDRNRFADRS